MKKNSSILYSENQYFILLIVPIILISVAIILFDILNIGTKPIPTGFNVLFQAVFLLILLIFYKLRITISKEFVVLKFGIGLINKKIKLSEINDNGIEECYIPWYYGMGLRLTKNGKIYNTSFGKGVKLSVGNKILMIGTKNSLNVKKIIINAINNMREHVGSSYKCNN